MLYKYFDKPFGGGGGIKLSSSVMYTGVFVVPDINHSQIRPRTWR
jgi:hypothetical protein